MKFVFASDSFKGSLTSEKTAQLLSRAAGEVFGGCETVSIPVSDGGEGTIDAIIKARGGQKIYVDVHDPLMKGRRSYYGRLDERTAVIEMALASGLTLIPQDARNPLETTSYGTGELVAAALAAGYEDIIITIGGSATNDGGMGFAAALGAVFFDKDGKVLQGRGSDLEKVADIDLSELERRTAGASFTVMCDVRNPLCGKNGASYTFGAQKGGSPKVLDRLERGMLHYKEILISKTGIDPDACEGSGAAGGLGAALLVFLKAKMQSGIETVLDMVDFDAAIKDADCVITGEGRSDAQSCFGKVVQGVAARSKRYNIPVVALCGSLGEGYEELYDHGVTSFMTILDSPMELATAMERAEEMYYDAALRMFRLLKI